MLDAPPDVVWDDLADVASHVEWMADARAIRFLSAQTSGVGTRFECDTKIGPITLTDVMEITEWKPGKAMGVRHTGLITGTGRFTLRKARHGRTHFQWKEKLTYPSAPGRALRRLHQRAGAPLGVEAQPPPPRRALLSAHATRMAARKRRRAEGDHRRRGRRGRP